ncbi:MAG: hypothetical protein NC226_03340 [Bacteroides cellulosilyticus]|nr:hypothetical protein [Bacteroides cellulosilyticus]
MKKILIFIAILGSNFYAHSQILLNIETDKDFKKVTILLTNKFNNEVILSTYSPLLSDNRNMGIKVDFRDDSNIISTWTYPFQAVGRKFHSAFPISPQETLLIEPDLFDISKRLGDELKSIEVSVGFLMINPTTNERYKVWDSFGLNSDGNKLERNMILCPVSLSDSLQN